MYSWYYTSGVWCCVYLVQLLRIPGEIEHTDSVLQHNHYPVCGVKGGGGCVSVFIVQTSDSKPMECVNYCTYITVHANIHYSWLVREMRFVTCLSLLSLTALTGVGNSSSATCSFLRSSQIITAQQWGAERGKEEKRWRERERRAART